MQCRPAPTIQLIETVGECKEQFAKPDSPHGLASDPEYLLFLLERREMKTTVYVSRGQNSLRFLELLSVFIFAAQFSPVLCQGQTDSSNELEVKVGKTVEITASSINYCWYATVHRFSTGEILATMRMSGDDANPEGEFSAYSISKDGGQTWSRRYTMGAGANVDAAYTQVTREDGTIWSLGAGYDSLEASPPGQATEFHAVLTRFSRGGMEFDQVRDARIRLSEPALSKPPTVMATGRKDSTKLDAVYEANPWGAIVVGPGGEWLTTFYYMTEREPRQQRLVLIRSTDEGRSWEEDATIATLQPSDTSSTWMGKDGPNEAALVRLSKDRLLCLFRTGSNDYMGEAWSADNGKTWTVPVSSGFKGVAPHLRLLSDGLLASTYGRPGPVTIMLSADEGKTWTNVTPIFDGMSTHYTDLIEVEPGKLLVVYDNTPYGPKAIPSSDTSSKNAIYGTFVEIRRR